MTTIRRRQLALGTAAGVAFATLRARPSRAEPPPTPVDRSVAEKYQHPTPGSDIDTGGAIIAINTPLDPVMKVLRDYRRYYKILPRLEQSRIMGKKDGVTELYMRAPIMSGFTHIWALSHLSEHKYGPAGRRIRAKYIKGNLDTWHGQWLVTPCGANRTLLKLELFLDPKVPVPASLATRELKWAAAKGVTAVRDMAECNRSSVADD